jgi:hypothetical protein
MAGYDPYGAAGALAKLYMASGTAGLVAQNFDNISGDVHGSFNNRLALIFQVMQSMCSLPSMQRALVQTRVRYDIACARPHRCSRSGSGSERRVPLF